MQKTIMEADITVTPEKLPLLMKKPTPRPIPCHLICILARLFHSEAVCSLLASPKITYSTLLRIFQGNPKDIQLCFIITNTNSIGRNQEYWPTFLMPVNLLSFSYLSSSNSDLLLDGMQRIKWSFLKLCCWRMSATEWKKRML